VIFVLEFALRLATIGNWLRMLNWAGADTAVKTLDTLPGPKLLNVIVTVLAFPGTSETCDVLNSRVGTGTLIA
jgi:hypothetical protein